VKRIALAAVITLATATVAWLLWRFRGAASLFLLSIALAAVARPAIAGLEGRLGRTLAVTLVYVSGIALAGLFFYVVSRGVLHELDEAVQRLGSGYDRLLAGAANNGALSDYLLRRLPPAAALYEAIGGARPTRLFDQALGVTRNVFDVVAQFLVVVALSAYWNSSREALERLWLSLVPARRRPRARHVWRSVEASVGSHLRSELAQSVLVVLILAVTFRLARMPLPMLPALAAGVLRLIPFFGIPLVAAAAFVAGNTIGPGVGAAAAALAVLVIVALDRVIARGLLVSRRPSPTLTVFLVVALVEASGFVGLLLASTLAMALQVCAERMLITQPRRIRRDQSVALIEAQLEGARHRLLLLPEADAMQLGSVITRLGALTTEARSQLR
jgi:predicted PurR-regulated permease PerM